MFLSILRVLAYYTYIDTQKKRKNAIWRWVGIAIKTERSTRFIFSDADDEDDEAGGSGVKKFNVGAATGTDASADTRKSLKKTRASKRTSRLMATVMPHTTSPEAEKDIEIDIHAKRDDEERKLYSYDISDRPDISHRRGAVDYTGTNFQFIRKFNHLLSLMMRHTTKSVQQHCKLLSLSSHNSVTMQLSSIA